MRKLKLFFACLLMAVLSIGQMWAEETLLFSQTYPGSPSGYPNSYTGSYTLTTGDYTLTYANINNGTKAADNWTAVRAGRKKNASVASVTTGQIATAVSKVTITFTQVNADLTNDLYLEVADNANFTSATKISQTIALSEVAFTIASPAANQYYRIMIDQKSGSNNGFTRFSGVAFYYNEGGGDDPVTPTPSLSVSPTEIDFGSVELGASVPSEALTVTFANLTGDVTYSTLGGPFSASGTIEASGDQITISAEAAEAGQYSETFTVQSNEDNLSKTVTVKMNVFEPFYGLELTFPAYNDESIGSYSSTWTATKSEQVWTIANFNNNKNGWNLIKAGSKNNTSVASITTYVENPVESIVVTVSSVTADLVNSHKLYVADNSSFDNAIEIDGNPATIAAGDITYVIPEADRANNLYYKLEYDLKQGSANGFLQITKLTYAYGTAAPQKPAAGLAYAEADKKQLVKFGETFTAPTLSNPNNLTNITYASNNTEVAEVDVNGAVTIKAIGVAVIAVSFAGDDNYKAGSDTYTICVVNHLGTEADPFDVADARRVIDAFGTKEGVYMSGIVSQITTPYDETYHNISFDISTDGTPTADQVRAYRCKGLDNTDFTSEDDVKTGATVTVYGNLKKYNSTYEFDAGCYLKAYEAPAVPKTPIANTKETAYTVAQALVYAADGATYDLDDYVYISGVVYDVQNFNNGKLSIFIKDADAENQFELYNCAGINDGSATTPFESINDVKVGNVVIGYGQMMYYQQGDIYEFKAGNYLAELQKPITGVWISEISAEVEAGATYTLTANVLPTNATGTVDWTIESGDAYASVADGVVTGIAEGVATIRATAHGTEFYKECTVTVTVPAPDTRSVANGSDFEAISGDLTPADIKFAAYKGDGTTNPQINNKNIRIYKPASGKTTGGYLKLTALMGYKIDQVEITFNANATASYAVDDAEFSAVAYIDGEETLLTPTGLDAQSVSIVNLKSGSIDVKAIKVWYTGAALPIDHYFLGGTYQTEFVQYGAFNYDGLKVYAAYDELETIKEEIFDFTVQANLMTYGNKKAEVYRNSVKIAEYDITVTESPKQNPALAYEPKYDEITLGDAWTAPAFSNPLNVAGITFSSNKTSVAKVTNEGVITLEGGCGTAVITAHFAETEEYVESTATYTIIVNEPAEDLSGTWVVATSVEVGDRIIIANEAAAGAIKTMGAQNGNNRIAVASTVDNFGVLTPANGTKTFLVVATGEEGEVALKALNGAYLYAASNSSNHLKEEASIDENGNANWKIEIDANGIATIKAQGTNSINWIRFNTSGLFSCYGATNNQKDVVIYKHGTPDYGSYQRDVTNGNYGTICLPKAGVISGATLFEIADYDGSMIYVDEILSGEMEAGKPYIFQATSEQLNVVYTSSVAEETAGHANGLYGFYNLENENAQYDITQDAGNYILYQNAYWLVSGRAAYIANYRAYIKLNQINNTGNQAPGRRRVAMAVNGEQVATGFENIDATEKPVKLMLNGQIYILRGEKMYDATGRLVK